MKQILTLLLIAFFINNAKAQTKNYVDIFKDIIASGADNFNGFVGEKFLENENGTYYYAPANEVDADTVYFANLKKADALGYYAVYHNYNLKQIEVLNQMNVFMNDYNNDGLAKVQLIPQGNVDYLLMTNKNTKKWMAVLMKDKEKNELQVWVFSGWK